MKNIMQEVLTGWFCLLFVAAIANSIYHLIRVVDSCAAHDAESAWHHIYWLAGSLFVLFTQIGIMKGMISEPTEEVEK